MNKLLTLAMTASLSLALACCEKAPEKPQQTGGAGSGTGAAAGGSGTADGSGASGGSTATGETDVSKMTPDDVMAAFVASLKEADVVAAVSLMDEESPAYAEVLQFATNLDKVQNDPNVTADQKEFLSKGVIVAFNQQFGGTEYQKIGEEAGVTRYTLTRPEHEPVTIDVLKKDDKWVISPKSNLLGGGKAARPKGPTVQPADMGGRPTLPPKPEAEPSGEAPADGSGEPEPAEGGDKPQG